MRQPPTGASLPADVAERVNNLAWRGVGADLARVVPLTRARQNALAWRRDSLKVGANRLSWARIGAGVDTATLRAVLDILRA